jgi:hypothetical protein
MLDQISAWTRSWWDHLLEFAEVHDTAIVALGTVLLAAFTIVLAVATVFLWRATRDLVRDAQDKGERQLRAYVTLDNGAVIQTVVNNGPRFMVLVNLKNYGSTPAYDFTTWIMQPEILDLSALPFGQPTPLGSRSGQSVIGPQAGATIRWFSTMSPEQLASGRARQKGIFIWGGADYKDAFGNPRKFIFRCTITGEQTESNGTGWGLSPHKLGYDAN